MSELAHENRALISFWDGGRCHFTRSMTVADEMLARGFEVGAITSEKYASEVSDTLGDENTFVVPNRPDEIKTPPYKFPLYSHAFTHAQRLMGLGFDNTSWLQGITDMEIAAIDTFKPNVIVNDYRDTIRTSAEYRNVPVVAINHSTGNVDGFRFGWWVDPPKDTVLPTCIDSFNEVRSKLGLPEITDERYMFSGNHNLLPSIEEIDPLQRQSPNSTYVGMLSNWQRSGAFTPIDAAYRPRIFSYASGEVTRPQYGIEAMVSSIVANEKSTGFYIVAGDQQRYANNAVHEARAKGRVVLEEYVPGYDATKDSDLVLTQGGSGTVALSLSLGKPMICIGPPQSDCSSVFRGVEQNHAGIMLNHSDGPLERMKAPDLGDNVDIFGYWDTEITASKILDTIRRVLDDPTYAQNARRLGDKLVALGGASAAVDIVEQTIEHYYA